MAFQSGVQKKLTYVIIGATSVSRLESNLSSIN